MGSRYLTDLDVVLRGAGLSVVELDGWQSRARSSGGYDGAPWAIFWHHTASAGDGAADAHYCTYGSSDRPVCNLVIGRDGVVHLCAAGATNTNGKGGPYLLPDGRTIPLDSANSRVIGIEFSNNGVGMSWPAVQLDAGFAASNALCRAYIDGKVTNVVQHVDWAPTRKIDPAQAGAVQGAWRPRSINSSGSWSLDDLRSECSRRAGSAPTPGPRPPDPGKDDDVEKYLVRSTDGMPWVTDFASYATQITEEQAADGVNMRGYVKGADNEPFPLSPSDSDLMLRLDR